MRAYALPHKVWRMRTAPALRPWPLHREQLDASAVFSEVARTVRISWERATFLARCALVAAAVLFVVGACAVAAASVVVGIGAVAASFAVGSR